MQEDRKDTAKRQAYQAAKYYKEAITEDWDMDLTDFGFDFMLEDMLDSLAGEKTLIEQDVHREVTAKFYKEEFRAEYEKHFGAK